MEDERSRHCCCATIGSTIVFRSIKYVFGHHLAKRASALFVENCHRASNGCFQLSVFLRLASVFPFFAVNIVAGMLRVDLKTFVITTFLGIIPGSLAFSLDRQWRWHFADTASSAVP